MDKETSEDIKRVGPEMRWQDLGFGILKSRKECCQCTRGNTLQTQEVSSENGLMRQKLWVGCSY